MFPVFERGDDTSGALSPLDDVPCLAVLMHFARRPHPGDRRPFLSGRAVFCDVGCYATPLLTAGRPLLVACRALKSLKPVVCGSKTSKPSAVCFWKTLQSRGGAHCFSGFPCLHLKYT